MLHTTWMEKWPKHYKIPKTLPLRIFIEFEIIYGPKVRFEILTYRNSNFLNETSDGEIIKAKVLDLEAVHNFQEKYKSYTTF